MQRLDPAKLHVTYLTGSTATGPLTPRCYTLTHSDSTGDLFLSIGPQYNTPQISAVYTRLMRDEVLAEWLEEESGLALHVHCHVSGGFAVGGARWRDQIFRHELPLVLEAFRYAELPLLEAEPQLDRSPVRIHFHSSVEDLDRVEDWGVLADYR